MTELSSRVRSVPSPAAGLQPDAGLLTIRRRVGGQMPLVIAASVLRLLSAPVRLDDIQLGVVVDVIFDGRLARAVGLEVRCGDGEHRFLPLAAARSHGGEVAVSSALALLDPPQLAFYARHGASFRALRAAPSHGLPARVAEVELTDGGSVARLELEGSA